MKSKEPYKFPLRIDQELVAPIKKTAKKNKRSINGEINIAIENHVNEQPKNKHE
jgi:hypothetical protein